MCPTPGPQRLHGFTAPLHPVQVLAWSVFAVCVILYFSLAVPFVPAHHAAEFNTFVFVYVGLFVIGFPLFLAVSLVDPALTAKQRNDRDAELDLESPLPLCAVCGIRQLPSTKHCYLCNKCIGGFDHHCLYLNTCVGERNYRIFFALIAVLTALLVTQCFVHLWLMAHYRDDDSEGAVRTSPLEHPLAWLILMAIVTVIPFLALLAILSLLAFHCYIGVTGESTYQWIIARRDRILRAQDAVMERELSQRRKQNERARHEIELQWRHEQQQRQKHKPQSHSNPPTGLPTNTGEPVRELSQSRSRAAAELGAITALGTVEHTDAPPPSHLADNATNSPSDASSHATEAAQSSTAASTRGDTSGSGSELGNGAIAESSTAC